MAEAETPARLDARSKQGAPRPGRTRRVSGRPFAIGFGLFLVLGTIVFTYLARQAQITREAAFDQMQREGVVPSGQ